MSSFTTPLLLEYLDGRTWRVLRSFEYMCDLLARVIQIPEGFVTDFASIPRVFWTVLSPAGGYGKAAVVHDWLYRTPGQASRGDADRVFREAMQVLRVGWLTRAVMYAGVRIGGFAAYHGGL